MSEQKEEFRNIPLNDIVVVSNTRSEFNENNLKELALSIKTNGVIQAITVKPMGGEKFRLITGERRFRASLLAGKSDIPARIVDIPDNKILQAQIIENLQRKNVSTMDEVRAIVRLRDEEAMTVPEIRSAIGKSPSHIEAQLRIARAAAELHDALDKNQISRAVAVLIAALDGEEKQLKAVKALKRDNIAYQVKAREAEKWINSNFGAQTKRNPGNHRLKSPGGKYANDWKYYLVRFSSEQFETFKSINRNQTSTEAIAESVEIVMLESERRAEV